MSFSCYYLIYINLPVFFTFFSFLFLKLHSIYSSMDWRRKSPRRRTWWWTMTTEEGWGGRRRRRPNWRPRPTQTRTTTSLQVNFPPSVVVWTFSSAYKETQHVRNRCSFCTQKALGVCRWRGHEVWFNCMKRFYGICFVFVLRWVCLFEIG